MRERNARMTLLLLVVVALLTAAMALPLSRFAQDSSRMQSRAIEQAITTAVLQCYALEGSYPPSLAYLRDNYGVIIDEEHYYYRYEIFASNIRPVIAVTPKNFAQGGWTP